MNIEYRLVDGFVGYRVGADGSVWSCLGQRRRATGYGSYTVVTDTWRQLKPWTKKKTGHKIATLYRDGKQHRRPVHVLVLEAFVGPRPEGLEACHWDGVPSNNVPDNLYWGTSADNGNDRRRHGRMPNGESHQNAKLTTSQVARLKTRMNQGEPIATMAREHGVTPQCLQSIKKGKSWARVEPSQSL